ncbi:hypothetical protein GCM10027063_47500 [Promicromonospora xylanilytica]
MNDRVTARGLTVALWAVTAGTIATALVLAAVDRLLLASAVCFLGCLPIALIAWGLERRTPPRGSAERRATGLRLGSRTAALGGAATTVGGALLIVAPRSVGYVPELLLSVGGALLLGGVSALQHVRSHDGSTASHDGSTASSSGAGQASAARAGRGAAFLLVRRNRYMVALWVAAVSAIAWGPALFSEVPRPLVGALVLLLGGLPLAALALTARRARDQESAT